MGKILITGGAGFIGSHLTKYLHDREHEIVVVDNLLRGNKIDNEILSKINFINGDVRDFELIKKISENCDYIFHFAAILGVDIVADNPVETMETETIGTKNIVDAALINNVKKVIYASTSGVYGHSAIEKSVDEDIMVDPRTSYAMAKRYNEIYLKAIHEEKGLESVSLRFFNVYGPKQDERMVIPRFFKQALSGEPITIFGNGNQTRDFTHINDTIKASVLLAENAKGSEIFNIANENEDSIINLYKYIKEITKSNSELKLTIPPSKRYDYEVERRVGSSEKLFRTVNFKPSIDLIDGLNDLHSN